MVVIVIISLLTLVGNYASLALRREKSRIEELTVELEGLIDREKTDALLGKTEGGEIVRKRKVEIDFDVPNEKIIYQAFVNLAKNIGDDENWETPKTKSWMYPELKMELYECPYTTWDPVNIDLPLTLELTGDTMKVLAPANRNPHLVLQISRNETAYREIHIDRRTGMMYERAGLSQIVSCD